MDERYLEQVVFLRFFSTGSLLLSLSNVVFLWYLIGDECQFLAVHFL